MLTTILYYTLISILVIIFLNIIKTIKSGSILNISYLNSCLSTWIFIVPILLLNYFEFKLININLNNTFLIIYIYILIYFNILFVKYKTR